ncbi:MAG: ribulose-phosphate 3-epimerase [Lactobacillales bacterium]|nr:ribulose-phosphate 3-epimerase [Lactobacillales bacterium]
MKLSPSILSADFANLGNEIYLVEKGGADYIHVDIMDGVFVPNLSMGPDVVKSIRSNTKLPLDVHLMMQNPDRFLDTFVKAGADILTVHVESTPHIYAMLQKIRAFGVKVGVSLNPGTPVCAISNLLSLIDQVLVMTVNPGFGGQAFLPDMLEKVKEVVRLREIHKYSFDIEVDGGIDEETIDLARKAGANVFVAGSYIYDSPSVEERMDILRSCLGLVS